MTPEQLEHLKKNIEAMQAWLNHAHDYLQDPINEVYQKLSQDSGADPGQSWINKINDAMFAIISSVDFPGAGVGSDFLQTLFGSYADPNATPDSLKKIFGDVWSRFSATFLQANDDLGALLADPDKAWSKTFTSPSTGKTVLVSCLADSNLIFPTEDGDPVAWNDMTDEVVTSFRYNLTKNVIGAKWSILHDPNVNFEAGWTDQDATNFAKSQVGSNRDVYLTWKPDQGGTCAGCPSNGISWSEPRLGVGAWYSNWDYFHGESAPKDMCDWLMKDDGFGTTLNPDAIATRKEVFCDWPIQGNLNEHPDEKTRKEAVQDLGPEASESDKQLASRWHELFKKTSRRDLEEQLVERALRDPAFKRDLIVRPRDIISQVIGVSLPSTANVTVVEEEAGDYTIVIPRIGRPRRPSLWTKFLRALRSIFF